MTDLKCITCDNYHKKGGICVLDEVPTGHGMAVNQIKAIWGITFQECKRYEVKHE